MRAWGVGAFTWRLRGRQVSMGTMMTPPPTPTRLPNVPAMPPAVFACACAYMHPLVRERAAAHLSFALWLALFLSPARALDFSFARIVSRPLLIICLLSPCVRAPARAGAQKCVSGAKIPTGRPSAAERPLAPPPLPWLPPPCGALAPSGAVLPALPSAGELKRRVIVRKSAVFSSRLCLPAPSPRANCTFTSAASGAGVQSNMFRALTAPYPTHMLCQPHSIEVNARGGERTACPRSAATRRESAHGA